MLPRFLLKSLLKSARLVCVALVFFSYSTILLVLMLLKVSKRDPAYFYSQSMMPLMLKILGIRLEIRGREHQHSSLPCVFVINHQNTIDLFVHGSYFPEGTVPIGKKSLKYIPIFGWIFVLGQCILIDRSKHGSAMEAMASAADQMLKKSRSIIVFPEGTRSGTRGLLPFKSGAFHLAVKAQRPVVGIVASSYHYSIDIGRWNSGTVLIQCLPPISTLGMTAENVPALSSQMHRDFQSTLEKLNHEIKTRRPEIAKEFEQRKVT